MKLAENILKDEENLLLQMANYLSDNRIMKKDLIEEFCVKHGVSFAPESIIKNGDFLFYRKHLKEKVNNTGKNKIQVPANSFELCLNKDKNMNEKLAQ